MDLQASHDFEDFVAIVEGRDTLVREIARSPRDLQDYPAAAAKSLLSEDRFLDVLPGFVLDSERVPIILDRLAGIAAGVADDSEPIRCFAPINGDGVFADASLCKSVPGVCPNVSVLSVLTFMSNLESVTYVFSIGYVGKNIRDSSDESR